MRHAGFLQSGLQFRASLQAEAQNAAEWNPAEWLSLLCRAVRQTAEAENNITSVERILDYTTLASEPPRVAEGAGPISIKHLAGTDHADKPPLRSWHLQSGHAIGLSGWRNLTAGGGAPPDGWPHSGEVEFQEVSACYRPGLPPVLNALSFTVKVRLAALLCTPGLT